MAIDSATKRKSISGLSLPLIPGVTPDADKAYDWRLASGWNYTGITVSGAVTTYSNYNQFIPYLVERPVSIEFVNQDSDLSFGRIYHGKSTILSG